MNATCDGCKAPVPVQTLTPIGPVGKTAWYCRPCLTRTR